MKNLILLAMLVLGTGFAQAQKDMMGMQGMDMMEIKMEALADIDDTISDLQEQRMETEMFFSMMMSQSKMQKKKDKKYMKAEIFLKHAKMVMSKNQMKRVLDMMNNEMMMMDKDKMRKKQ